MIERNGFDELINGIGKKYDLVEKIFKTNVGLNKEALCKGCYEVKKLTDEYGNREIVKLLYECRLNAKHHNNCIRWIPLDEFKNIKYLARASFEEVHKATWIKSHHNVYDVALKKICNSNC